MKAKAPSLLLLAGLLFGGAALAMPSAENSDAVLPNSPLKERGYPDAGRFNPVGAVMLNHEVEPLITAAQHGNQQGAEAVEVVVEIRQNPGDGRGDGGVGFEKFQRIADRLLVEAVAIGAHCRLAAESGQQGHLSGQFAAQ